MPPHHRGHLLSWPQPAVLIDRADALDAGHARVGDLRIRLALAGADLGLVDAERLQVSPGDCQGRSMFSQRSRAAW
jgi:hypothetical protein